MRRAGLAQAELLRLPELYHFAPFLIGPGLPERCGGRASILCRAARASPARCARAWPAHSSPPCMASQRADLQPYNYTTAAPALPADREPLRWLVDPRGRRSRVRVALCPRQVQTGAGRRENTLLIFDGIDTDVLVHTSLARLNDGLPRSDARVRLLFVGNRTRRKGFDLLPQIIDQLPSDYVLYYAAASGQRRRAAGARA